MMLQFVECTEDYWEFVRDLRNDEAVQGGFIEFVHISPAQQAEYMRKYAPCYRICLSDGIPAGYIGVIDDDIRVCTHPDFQQQGVGLFMVRQGMAIWPRAKARIKASNTASLELFRKAGFEAEFIIMAKSK